MDQHWMDQAGCVGSDSELFYSEVESDQLQALEICLNCPVMEQCHKAAMERGEAWGIWGSCTPEDRVSRGMTPAPQVQYDEVAIKRALDGDLDVELSTEDRRHAVWLLREQGKTRAEISEILGINERLITRDVAALARRGLTISERGLALWAQNAKPGWQGGLRRADVA